MKGKETKMKIKSGLKDHTIQNKWQPILSKGMFTVCLMRTHQFPFIIACQIFIVRI